MFAGAQTLAEQKRTDEAVRILRALTQDRNPAYRAEARFRIAQLLAARKDYAGAVIWYRQLLAEQPNVVPVRLALGQAFYALKDYDNAERQFRFARAGDITPAVKASIDRYLYLIRLERRFSYTLSVAAAPDTNLNAGPTTSTVSIFGLPFELSDQARKHSGVGASVDAGGEWSPSISGQTRLRLGAQAHRAEYGGGAFDDMTLSVYGGPRFIGRRWELSPLATAFRRWYGNQFYEDGAGATLQGAYYPAARIGVTASLGAQQTTFAQRDMSGPAVSTALGAFYTLNSAAVVSGEVAASRQQARLPLYSNTAVQLQLGYYRDLPLGFSIAVQPSFARIDYVGEYGFFGVVRRDRVWQAQASVLNRKIDWWGFTPRAAYTFTSTSSSIGLFAYDRQRVEMGLTRNF